MHDLRSGAAWVADHELWPLGLAVLLASASVRLAPWGWGLIALLWGVRWLGRGRLAVRTPWDGAVGLLLLMVPVTLAVTTDRAATLLAVSRLLGGLALAYGIANWARHDGHLALLALGLVGVGAALVLVGLLGTRWPEMPAGRFLGGLYGELPRALEDPLNPNMVAGGVVLLLPFPLAVLLWDPRLLLEGLLPIRIVRFLVRRNMRTAGLGLVAASMMLLLFLTQSRGSWLAAGVALSMLLGGRYRTMRKLAPVVFLSLGLGLLVGQGGLEVIFEGLGQGSGVVGWPERVEIWSRALYMVQDFPFTGVGADTFPDLLWALYPLFLLSPAAEIPHTHNLFLQVAVDLGLPGLVAFIAVVGLAVYNAGRVVARSRAPGRQFRGAVAWAALASLIAMLVHGLLDTTTWIVGWTAPLPWAVVGLVMALTKVTFEEPGMVDGSWVTEDRLAG